ncbi:MAG TPA: trypsin-like peptidase domain-containing protein [bacterium]|nr:trypsin-like peptidase domain-containing protein [bacterium]
MRYTLFLTLLTIFLVQPGCAGEETPSVELALSDTDSAAVESNDARITAERGNAITEATRIAAPSVVTISTITRITERVYDPGSDPFFNDPFFEEFFGRHFGPSRSEGPSYREREIPGMGSGFIISPDGYVLTAEHVVHSADEIEITLSDGRSFPGEVVGRDPYTDTAVVRITGGENLPIALLGDSDHLEVGQWAIAIGNPFGFIVKDPQPTVTVGVVSATNRTMRYQLATGEVRVFEGLIQTDAAINPGNSGGALVNSLGEVIGINSSILSTSGGNQGIGFAIPINAAREVAQEIIRYGGVRRSYIGFYLQDVTPSIAQAMGLRSTDGALVTQVDKGSPAEEAGLEPGDIVLSYNTEPITGVDGFNEQFQRSAPGDDVVLVVQREGRQYRVALVIAERDEET